MFRISNVLRASVRYQKPQKCPYEVLGVSRGATEEQIKEAFRGKAKQTHPDISKGQKSDSAAFRETVEAYKILRDPRRRAEYDRDRKRDQQPSEFSNPQWPQGEGQNMSPEFRAKMYGYKLDPEDEGVYTRGPQPVQHPGLLIMEWMPIFTCGLVFVVLFLNRITKEDYDAAKQEQTDVRRARIERDLRRQQYLTDKARKAEEAAAKAAGVDLEASGNNLLEDSAATVTLRDKAGKVVQKIQDDLVLAYWNPFAGTWHRIPDGYEAPAAMDLTAWHNKRTDPVEWARLLADGRLSEMVPRGGLKTKMVPPWDVREPILVGDPITGKTLAPNGPLPPRSEVLPACDVQF
mmetsp:Transcript_60506/g.128270  ORF Transcript_60506/g.128270 Transcript_60506/m.128270 type:complete len:348 (-) Transcript_60506:357-1400(-)